MSPTFSDPAHRNGHFQNDRSLELDKGEFTMEPLAGTCPPKLRSLYGDGNDTSPSLIPCVEHWDKPSREPAPRQLSEVFIYCSLTPISNYHPLWSVSIQLPPSIFIRRKMTWNCQERPSDAFPDTLGPNVLDSEHLPSSHSTPRKGIRVRRRNWLAALMLKVYHFKPLSVLKACSWVTFSTMLRRKIKPPSKI